MKTIFKLKAHLTWHSAYSGDEQTSYMLDKIYDSYSEAEQDMPNQYSIEKKKFSEENITHNELKLYFQVEKYFDLN